MMLIVLLTSFFLCQFISADQAFSKQAESVLNSIVYKLPASSIIGKREWQELQLDHLVDVLDRTTTSFGRWGLVKLLHPIVDAEQLKKRKEIITFLVNNSDQMKIVQEQLQQIKLVEKSLLAYWDEHDSLNNRCESFYFSSFGLKALNKNAILLNASASLEMVDLIKHLIAALALTGVGIEFLKWLHGEQEDFDIIHGLRQGLEIPVRYHSLSSCIITEDLPSYGYKDCMKAFLSGTWYDKYWVLYKGYSLKGISYVPTGMQNFVLSLGKPGAIVGATIPTLLFDYQWGNALISVGKRIVGMNTDLNELQERVSDVAHGLKSIMYLQKMTFAEDDMLTASFDIIENQQLELLVTNLLHKRFLKKSKYLYSRGHVLKMHRNIKKIKQSLIPLLRFVALLDAYCSIAQLYLESQNNSVKFSFSQFIESSVPVMQYYNGWLPLLPFEQAVTNDFEFGGGHHSSKMIITGPNGGGKSTILKMYGIAAVLAQSWCIIPADYGRQTLLTSIKTSFAPCENLEQGLSTFMAEKKIMTELLSDIQKSDIQHPMLVLIDEPYKGTVDDESAKRIYQFGKDVADYDHALVAIATHVKKPIYLEQDNGIFGNYQVKINEVSPGIFERLFKIEKGPATWWFEDEDKRGRFIDWIGMDTGFSLTKSVL